MDPVPETKQILPIPGRNPFAMLKNGEPMPESAFFLRAAVDPDRNAAHITVYKGRMGWTQYPESVHLQLEQQADGSNPLSVKLIYTTKQYNQKDREPHNRTGAGYSGLSISEFDQSQVQSGMVMITKDPASMTSFGRTFQGPVDLLADPQNQEETYRVFDVNDPDGPIEAAAIIMEAVAGLPKADSTTISGLLRQKLTPPIK